MNVKLCQRKGLVLSMVTCSMMTLTVLGQMKLLLWINQHRAGAHCPEENVLPCVCAVIEDKRQFPAAERGHWLPRNVESALAGKLHSSSALWLSCEFDINTTCNLKSGKYGKSLCKAKNVACESRPPFSGGSWRLKRRTFFKCCKRFLFKLYECHQLKNCSAWWKKFTFAVNYGRQMLVTHGFSGKRSQSRKNLHHLSFCVFKLWVDGI